jgi:hypothetical protein
MAEILKNLKLDRDEMNTEYENDVICEVINKFGNEKAHRVMMKINNHNAGTKAAVFYRNNNYGEREACLLFNYYRNHHVEFVDAIADDTIGQECVWCCED